MAPNDPREKQFEDAFQALEKAAKSHDSLEAQWHKWISDLTETSRKLARQASIEIKEKKAKTVGDLVKKRKAYPTFDKAVSELEKKADNLEKFCKQIAGDHLKAWRGATEKYQKAKKDFVDGAKKDVNLTPISIKVTTALAKKYAEADNEHKDFVADMKKAKPPKFTKAALMKEFAAAKTIEGMIVTQYVDFEDW